MAGNRIGGVLNFTIDGTQYPVRGNFEVMPSTVKREDVAGQDYVHGYVETPVVPGVKGDISTVPGLSCAALEAIVDSTLQVTLANGTTYVLSEAWCKSAFTISTTEGKLAVDFGCKSCDEVVAAS